MFKNKIVSVVFGVVLAVSVLAFSSEKASASQISTNTTTAGTYTLLSARNINISQVQVLAGAAPVQILLYDSVGVTNYTNIAYIGVGSYTTSIISTVVSPLTGYTNSFTNTGIFTYTNTVAANTNNALPYTLFPAQANTMATYPVDLHNVRGLTIVANTNATVAITYTDN